MSEKKPNPKRRLKYEKPRLIAVAAAGNCSPTGVSATGECVNGGVANKTCWTVGNYPKAGKCNPFGSHP